MKNRFDMNGEWGIIEEDVSFLKELYKKENNQEVTYLFGLTHYPTRMIYINKYLCIESKKKTLRHELMHAYIYSYCSEQDMYDEEEVCNICANSYNIISKIVDWYFRNNENG